MTLEQREHLERRYHESEDQARSQSALIRSFYSSGLFDETEHYLLDVLGEISGADVLDYGCGGGWSLRKLRARGARATGVDISHTRLMEAKGHLSAGDDADEVNLLQASAESLPFASASFDAVFGKQILHHLNLEVAVPEVARVLRPGAKAVFLEPLIHNPLLQGYRRLTPHLRSPTERALSMRDLQRIGAHFGRWSHEEFCFLSVVPDLFDALVFRRPALRRFRFALQKLDRQLVGKLPFIGRYYWATVLVLER